MFMPAWGDVYIWSFVFLISFSSVGQEGASKTQAVTNIDVVGNAFWTMKTNFKILADKFSILNEQDNNDFISFYKNNEREIEDLNDFETDEELYLSAVINHTYGRSLLYEAKDYQMAEKHLDIARSLILNNKKKFNLELKEDAWY